jgi:ankyrin repeat protein
LVEKRDVHSVRSLIELGGVDINETNVMGMTVLQRLFCSYPDEKCVEMIKVLLDAGARYDILYADGGTLMKKSCCHWRSSQVIMTLLEAGMNVQMIDGNGHNALYYSVMHNSDATLTLLQAGIDVNFVDRDGNTAIIYAADESNFTAMKLLIEYGADVNVLNEYGMTPLHIVIRYGKSEQLKVDMACLLIGAGVNMSIIDKNGRLALDMHPGIDELIIKKIKHKFNGSSN